MDWITYLIGGIIFGAVILAIYEKRKGLRIRDERVRRQQTETDRDVIRAVHDRRN